MKSIIPKEIIENKIFLIRGQKVMIDRDLAYLYEVKNKALIQSIKRNPARFPEDFVFQLNENEFTILRSQIVTSNWGGRRYLPFAFTEQGIAMLSSVLKSKRAINVNIEIMRTFSKLRQLISSHKDIMRIIEEMENKYDKQFKIVFDAIRALIEPKPKKIGRIGFRSDRS